MHWFTLLFLAALVAGTLWRVYLSARQIRAMAAARHAVPAPFDSSIELPDHQKACDYTAANSRVAIPENVYDAFLLVGWTLFGGLNLLDNTWQALGLSPVMTGVGVIVSGLIIMAALSLPFSIYNTFVLEERFGFNKTTPGMFVLDMVKGLVVALVLGVPLVAVILWLMDSAGDYWWLYAWLVWTGFSLAITWAYPAFIAPLFNKFSPLSDDGLKQRIEKLLERCGFRSSGIFVMDGSTRSTHGNAYFTGVGNNKRIVFFDTLIGSLEPLEVEAVLAHELGHFRLRHIRKRLLMTFAMGLVGLAVLGWLKTQPWFYTALGVETPSSYMALMLFMMVSPLFTFALTPLSARTSRRHEFEADEYAATQSDASALIDALVKLYRDNATALSPDQLHSTFYDSHPPGPIRVAKLQALAAT
ncbi:MAG: M48 family metallopeptidase [Gammaproteobacteria bacterium]